ncbi:MAG: hypothetical protein J6W27_00985 [Alphaproteobacteria bacterium]|nr:hypothetical protein [Alphaproteobacteria bacterium]
MKNKNYKLFILMSFLLLGGCTTKHKNVVTGIGTIDNRPMLLLEDTENNKERIYYIPPQYLDEYRYTFLDDTVTIGINPMRAGLTDRKYQLTSVLKPDDCTCSFNNDSIRARTKREQMHNDSVYATNQYKELEYLKQQIKPSPQNIK